MICLGTGADELAVGAMPLAAADRHPLGEPAVQLSHAGEAATGQDVVAHDRDLPLHPALPGRAVRGEHVDDEPVVLPELLPGLNAAASGCSGTASRGAT